MAPATGRVFFDTNVVIYLFEQDAKALTAEKLISAGGTVSVQVLSEFVQVSRSKRKRELAWIESSLRSVRALCDVEAISIVHHELAWKLIRAHAFHIYDAMIVASALTSGCSTLYTEGLQHGQLIDQQLRVVNPFA